MDDVRAVLHDMRLAASLYDELVSARAIVDTHDGRDALLTGLDAEFGADLAAASARVADRQRRARQLEGELRDLEMRLQERRGRRAQIKDAHGAQALVSELARMQDRRDALEAELLAAWQAVESEAAQLQSTSAAVAAQHDRITNDQHALGAQHDRAVAAQSEVAEELVVVLGRLPDSLAGRLRRLASRLGNPIAGMTGGACDVCGYSLPAQKAMDVDCDRSYPICAGCGRFIVARRGLRRGEWVRES